MSILKRENRIVLITGIICVLIVVLAVNYTYSFFAVEKTNSSVITGEVESMKLNVNVTRIATTTDSKLIPQLDAYITYAVKGRTGNCLDDNGNTVCHVYKVTLQNQGTSSVNVSGSLVLTTTNNNLKWARVTGLTNPTLINDVKAPAESDFVISDELQSGTSRDYYMVVWISETGSSQTDSNNYTGTVTFTTIDGNMAGSANIENSYTQIDNSGANAPAYVENLIPVMYDTNTNNWVVADTTSSTSTYGWYDYDAKKWANAVLLTESKRNNLTIDANGNYTPGQSIGDSETDGVLAFYVWIPRFKYKVWNINKKADSSVYTYNAYTTGIDIEFENGIDTTGTILCSYRFVRATKLNGEPCEICSDVSGGEGYYTHPAFKFGNDNVTGIWMGKFELSSTYQDATSSGGGAYGLGKSLRILPNVMSIRGDVFYEFWREIKDMQKSSNIYGITTDTTITDTHMITNMEWGAVAYLTHSEYGRCTGSTCTEVSKNNSFEVDYGTAYTGRSAGVPASSSVNYSEEGTYTYETTNGQLASTTGNIYGVYDMSGGSQEYVMAAISTTEIGYNHLEENSDYYTYVDNEKYITTYTYGASTSNQNAYNRGRLGDATSEVQLEITDNSDGWYGDYDNFMYYSSTTGYHHLIRGGFGGSLNGSQNSNAGIFNFNNDRFVAGDYISTRAILIGF